MSRPAPLAAQPRPRALKSEEVLMLAVLEQALADLDHSCPAVRADAEAYFLAYGLDSSAFSFEAVCAQFGFSPSAIRAVVREKIRARKAHHPAIRRAA